MRLYAVREFFRLYARFLWRIAQIVYDCARCLVDPDYWRMSIIHKEGIL